MVRKRDQMNTRSKTTAAATSAVSSIPSNSPPRSDEETLDEDAQNPGNIGNPQGSNPPPSEAPTGGAELADPVALESSAAAGPGREPANLVSGEWASQQDIRDVNSQLAFLSGRMDRLFEGLHPYFTAQQPAQVNPFGIQGQGTSVVPNLPASSSASLNPLSVPQNTLPLDRNSRQEVPIVPQPTLRAEFSPDNPPPVTLGTSASPNVVQSVPYSVPCHQHNLTYSGNWAQLPPVNLTFPSANEPLPLSSTLNRTANSRGNRDDQYLNFRPEWVDALDEHPSYMQRMYRNSGHKMTDDELDQMMMTRFREFQRRAHAHGAFPIKNLLKGPIRKYTGEKDMARQWFRSFTQFMNCSGITDEEGQALYLPTYLEGQAMQFYNQLRYEVRINMAYLRKVFAKQFTRDRRTIAESISVTQKIGETAAEYALRLQDALGDHEEYQQMSVSVSNALLTSLFLRGLRNEPMYVKVRCKDYPTLYDAQEEARMAEKIHEAEASLTSSMYPINPQQEPLDPSRATPSMEEWALMTAILNKDTAAGIDILETKDQNEKRAKIHSWCNRDNQGRHEWVTRQPRDRKQYERAPQTRKTENVIRCYNCKQVGHFVWHCREPARRRSSPMPETIPKTTSQPFAKKNQNNASSGNIGNSRNHATDGARAKPQVPSQVSVVHAPNGTLLHSTSGAQYLGERSSSVAHLWPIETLAPPFR